MWMVGTANVYAGSYAFATCSPNYMPIWQCFPLFVSGKYNLSFAAACGDKGNPTNPVCNLQIIVNNKLFMEAQLSSSDYLTFEIIFTANNENGVLTIEAKTNSVFWIDNIIIEQIGNLVFSS